MRGRRMLKLLDPDVTAQYAISSNIFIMSYEPPNNGGKQQRRGFRLS